MPECERCGYKTSRKSSLIKHLQNENCPCKFSHKRRTTLLKQLGGHQPQHQPQHTFEMICLGNYGGVCSGNISSYLLRAQGQSDFICLDGGSPIDGIWKYNETSKDKINPKDLKAFLVSHAHLDHIAGLAIASPAYFGRQIDVIAMEPIIKALNDHVFNDTIWPSILFGNDKVLRPNPLEITTNKQTANMNIECMPVKHGNYANSQHDSTVFFISNANDYILYFGDVSNQHHASYAQNTNAKVKLDAVVKKSKTLNKKLKAIFLECAMPTTGNPLFGHLDGAQFLQVLAPYADLYKDQKIKVFVTHVKPALSEYNNIQTNIETIKKDMHNELQKVDKQNICQNFEFIFPVQGQKYNI